MPHSSDLPRAIDFNNPGKLRSYPGLDYNDGYEYGMANFRCMHDGLKSLVTEIWSRYTNLGYRTIKLFATMLVSDEHENMLRVEMDLCQELGISPLQANTFDLRLDREWNAFQMARAVIKMRCGRPPSNWRSYPEWCSPAELANAMKASGKWRQ